MLVLSEDLQVISDTRKTAIINNELKRLDVDKATLQETRIADTERERLHLLLARKELRIA